MDSSHILLVIGILVISYSIHELKQIEYNMKSQEIGKNPFQGESKSTRIAWIDGHGKNPLNTYMLHIYQVFKMLGYQVITGPQPSNVKWDVMWIHDYSLTKDEYKDHIKEATIEQIINHVPGSGYYTSKVSLATATGISSGIPKAFQLPSEKNQFLQYAQLNPNILWVQKDNTHRNIKIKAIDEVELNKENSFVQRFVENPLLIDNRKFDIGIYAVITSLLPLRVYLFDGDALIRFCPSDYHPFDDNNVDKYVVGDDYTPIWEIPSLIPYYKDSNMGWRGSLDSYLKKNGKDPMKIWAGIGETIAQVFLKQQGKMLASYQSSPINAQYFELSRFDFVVDEELNVYLMEANMSPNLSSGHFKQNKNLYERVIFNVLSLVGIAAQISKEASKEISPTSNLLISSKDLQVGLSQCWDDSCISCDSSLECQLCGHCLTDDTMSYLQKTFIEHQNRKSMRLIPFYKLDHKPLTKEDYLLSIWLQAKCSEDQTWC